MFWNQYPYININDLNLDFLLKSIGDMKYEVENFVSINAIKYANPIQWDITSQYEKNTIVIDPQSGTAYISVKPVPVGVALTNTDYWSVVFDLERFVTKANGNFTLRVEEQTTLTATFPTPEGSWVVWGGDLYRALSNIIAGDQYVVNSNIERITVEEMLIEAVQALTDADNIIKGEIGDLTDLDTTDKTNTVSAINEVVGNVGDLSDLDTTDKTNTVSAINEVLGNVGDLTDLNTTDKTNTVSAINEVVGNVGDLSDLDTSVQSDIVSAINEVINTTITNIDNAKDELLARDCCIRPEDFGAIGDGVADDTLAIQACFNSADRLTKKILMTGKYKLTNKVTLNSNTYIVGHGIGEIVDAWNNTTVPSPLVRLNATLVGGDSISNVTIDGIKFTGSGARTHYIYEYTLRIENSNDIRVSRCAFLDQPTISCVCLVGCNNTKVIDCYIKEYTRSGIVFIEGTSNSTVENCIVLNGHEESEPNRYPISICAYENAYTDTSPAPTATNNQCIHNYIEDAVPKWEAIDAHGGINFVIHGNVMIGTATGISAFTDTPRGFTSYRVQVTNNIYVSRGASATGVSCGFAITANESVISDNVIVNAGRYSTNGTAYGLYISTIGANSIVANNIFMGCGKYAIFTSSSLNSIKFSNNIINYVVPIDGESYAFYFSQWATWDSVIIDNNIFRGPISVIVRAPATKQNNYSAIIMRNNNYHAVAPTFENVANIAPDLASATDIAASSSGAQGLICRNYGAAVGTPHAYVFVASNPLQNAGTWRALANIT